MDNFKAVYMILAALEKAMDYPEFDLAVISPEALQISKERWSRYIEMMADVGYIKGVRISRDVLGNTNVSCADIRSTLKSLEDLHENSVMRKIYDSRGSRRSRRDCRSEYLLTEQSPTPTKQMSVYAEDSSNSLCTKSIKLLKLRLPENSLVLFDVY